jgi:hypothetical protein
VKILGAQGAKLVRNPTRKAVRRRSVRQAEQYVATLHTAAGDFEFPTPHAAMVEGRKRGGNFAVSWGKRKKNPRGTRVAKCVRKLRKRKGVNAYAVCQSATGQSYATGRRTRNPLLPIAVQMGGATVAQFRSLPRARQYAQALANAAHRQVRVRT